jgi:Uncharacterised conserved protein (DUF2362)
MTLPSIFKLNGEAFQDLYIEVAYRAKGGGEDMIRTTLLIAKGRDVTQGIHSFAVEKDILYLGTEMITSESCLFSAAESLNEQEWLKCIGLTASDALHKTEWINSFKTRCAKYAAKQSSFIEAYLKIVTSEPTLFDTLLHLESSYKSACEEFRYSHQRNLDDLKARFDLTLLKCSPQEAQTISEEHSDDISALKATYEVQREELLQVQKQEYQQFVISGMCS